MHTYVYVHTQESTSKIMELSEAPKGYNSVHGVKSSDRVSSDFTGDEYTIYSTSQQRIRCDMFVNTPAYHDVVNYAQYITNIRICYIIGIW